jgi:hypothetical protein
MSKGFFIFLTLFADYGNNSICMQYLFLWLIKKSRSIIGEYGNG